MTKKINLFFVFFLSISLNSYSQISKGQWLLSGSISWSNNNSDNSQDSGHTTSNKSKSKAYSFSPKAAYLLNDRLALGLAFGVSRGTSNQERLSEQSQDQTERKSETISRGLSVSPFIRYYQPIQDRFGFYGQAKAGYRSTKLETERTSIVCI